MPYFTSTHKEAKMLVLCWEDNKIFKDGFSYLKEVRLTYMSMAHWLVHDYTKVISLRLLEKKLLKIYILFSSFLFSTTRMST